MKPTKIVPGDLAIHRTTGIPMKIEAVDLGSRVAYCSWLGRHGAEREAYYDLDELDMIVVGKVPGSVRPTASQTR